MSELNSLRDARDALDDQIQRMEWGLEPSLPTAPSQPALDVAPNHPIASSPSSSNGSTAAAPTHDRSRTPDHVLSSSEVESQKATVSRASDGMHASSSSSSSSSSSDLSVDLGDDAELASYREALANLKQQRDAVCACRLECATLVHLHRRQLHAIKGQLWKTDCRAC